MKNILYIYIYIYYIICIIVYYYTFFLCIYLFINIYILIERESTLTVTHCVALQLHNMKNKQNKAMFKDGHGFRLECPIELCLVMTDEQYIKNKNTITRTR